MTDPHVLNGIRILDFSWVLAGPYATRILADFGAEVIKIQPLLPEEEDTFSRGYSNTWNRNKRGITLDLNRREGVAVAKKLAGRCDAIVENFTPRVMANWGLDYESLKKLRPDLIMLSMSAMGSTGPWRDYTGFGATVHAFSGMTCRTSYPGGPPLGPGHSYADHASGLVATLALLGALEYRQRSGEGQLIDIAQTEVMAALMGSHVLDYSVTGMKPEPTGNRSRSAAPHGIYRCRGDDRWCAIVVGDDGEWRRFKEAMGNPPWANDSRLATLNGRLENADELERRVEEWTVQYAAGEVMALLQGAGLAAGIVQDARDLAQDPQLRWRDFFVKLGHPEMGKTVSDASPVRLSRTPPRYSRVAPLPGEDNEYVYGELLGMSPREMAGLKERGVI